MIKNFNVGQRNGKLSVKSIDSIQYDKRGKIVNITAHCDCGRNQKMTFAVFQRIEKCKFCYANERRPELKKQTEVVFKAEHIKKMADFIDLQKRKIKVLEGYILNPETPTSEAVHLIDALHYETRVLLYPKEN